jgi:phage/plasmid-associated DNA primase
MFHPVLNKYINDLSLNDEQFKLNLQSALGLLYNGNIGNKKMVVFHGLGSGGKSLLASLLHTIMGDACRTVTTDIIHNLGELQGVRCAILNELDHQRDLRFWGIWVKIMTGGDGGFILSPNGDRISCTSTFVPLMVTNEIPFDLTNPLIAQRVILIPFQAEFVDEVDPHNPSHRRQDIYLRERLLEDPEFMSALSDWIRDGASMHIPHPIKEPSDD